MLTGIDRIRAATKEDMVSMTDGNADEIDSLVLIKHANGYARIHLNRHVIGHSLGKQPLLRPRWWRWLVIRGWIWGYYWSWSTSHWSGAGTSTSCFSLQGAIREARQNLDEWESKYPLGVYQPPTRSFTVNAV